MGGLRFDSKTACFPIASSAKTSVSVTPAIIENKRFSHALATVKAQQDLKHEPKIQTNSENIGYKKNPRRVYGPNYSAKVAPAPAVEMTARRKARKT